MPLKLDEFLPEDDFIESPSGEKFYITARIPRNVFLQMKDIGIEFKKGIEECNLDKVNELLILALSVKNDPEKSKKFMDNLSSDFKEWNRVAIYIMNFIIGSVTEANEKKK